ncbi:nuclear pore complex protein NUP88 isoform X2 [Gastrolobium bilobum]|uniref:nuclear pore complex protein NUP88 isoform X2 n=1 Tax=Gastrolobium bilobum TaxID=150636 RepID=UPI002AB23275|nr:nuclear pore complex protein NUP88 isoform X2 [Gastrolobium bilobum]
MRITLDLEPNSEPSRSQTPKDEVEWVPLPKHPLFTATAGGGSAATGAGNLLAWDGASRLYFWDSNNNFLHRLSLRLGDPDPISVFAASPSKVLQADVSPTFDVQKISINRNGTAMLLSGSERLSVMYLYGRTSKKDVNLICRTITVGSQAYSTGSNDIRVLKALWHPYSDTHLGILSSDSVFRLFNLAVDPLQPEQEYYLQPVEPGRSRNASSVCPVDFSFGGDHLWDRFSVLILFSNGDIYVICPVVPFGSLFKCESLLEIYNDAHTFGLTSANSVAASNSKLAISWFEATFPELQNQETEGDNLSMLRAQAYALFDASLVLQGPLRRVGQGRNEDSVSRSAECEGRAISFLYNLVSKDSILVTAWSGGQLQIDALADEIQPVWSIGSPPRLRVDSHDQILGLAMICESIASSCPEKLDHNAWSGNPPPLLRLAVVDLALPKRAESSYNISLFIDTLMPERIYSLHDGGIDSIVLHFLPFTSQTNGKDDTMRTPSVHPVLNTCQSGCTSEPSLCGFVSLSDSFGYSWIVAVTLSQECVVLEMETWNLLLPVSIEMEKKLIQSEGESKERDIPTIISKELLSGPKEVLVPRASPSLRSVAADSIEGRSTLHQYFRLFHETYVEYAHKVHMELKHHAPQLKRIINGQYSRIGDAQQKLLKVEEKQSILQKRIDCAIQMHDSLEERLQQLRNLPCAHKKPLSTAERQFKSELDHFKEVELDALHSSVDALSARLRRHAQASKSSHQQQKISGKKICAGDDQLSMLKSSLEKLSLVNTENSKKVKVVESTLRNKERSSRESSLPIL